MDRLARNTEDLLRTVRELNEKGVAVTFVKEHLTFSGRHDPLAELMMTVLGGIAKFERALILAQGFVHQIDARIFHLDLSRH